MLRPDYYLIFPVACSHGSVLSGIGETYLDPLTDVLRDIWRIEIEQRVYPQS